jgi:hypothetical protein
MIVDQANEVGLNEDLNREFDMLNRVANARTKSPVAGYRYKKSSGKEKAITSVNERLSDEQLLTGVV